MYDFNPMIMETKKSVKKIIAFSPEQCPFRIYASQFLTENDGEICGLNISLGKGAVCICTSKRWIQGCPLLINDIVVVKN